MSKSKSLIFFGNERLATGVSTSVPTLQALVSAGYKVEEVIVSNKPSNSRSSRELEIEKVAKKLKIPLISDENLSNFSAQFGVLVAYGKIIPQSIIDRFPLGIINVHPSLLPKYRGPTPIESTILSDAHETGVSLMKLVAKMDAGPVYAQAKIKLDGKETKQQLAGRLSKAGAKLLVDNLDAILNGFLQPKNQDESKATYTVLIGKTLGNVDWSLPAAIIERQVRAYGGWPRSSTIIHGYSVIITKARLASSETDGALVIKASPGWLEIEGLIGPSGKHMSGSEFLRGYSKLR